MDAPLGTVSDRIPASFPTLRMRSSWVGLVLIAVVVVALAALFIRTVRTSDFIDFEAYYSGASALRHGEPLYARAAAYRDAGYALDHPTIPPPVEGMPYVYPPAFAVVLMPLSLLPYDMARQVWLVFLFGCLLVAAYVLTGLVFPRPAKPAAVAVAAVAVLLAFFQPARASLFSTNAELPTFLLVTLMTAALARGRWSQAAVWLALAATIKPTLGMFVLYLLWKRAYRATAISLALLAVLQLAPALIFGVGLLRELADIAAYWTQSPWAAGPINQSPYGLLLRLFTTNPYSTPVLDAPMLATVLRWTVVGLMLALVAALVRRTQDMPRRHAMLELGVVVTATLLLAPLTQDIYCIHLAIPLAIIAGTVLERPRTRQALLLGAGVALVYGYFSLPSLRFISQAYYLFHAAPLTGTTILLTGVYVYGLVAALAVVVTALRWYRRGEVGANQPEVDGLAA